MVGGAWGGGGGGGGWGFARVLMPPRLASYLSSRLGWRINLWTRLRTIASCHVINAARLRADVSDLRFYDDGRGNSNSRISRISRISSISRISRTNQFSGITARAPKDARPIIRLYLCVYFSRSSPPPPAAAVANPPVICIKRSSAERNLRLAVSTSWTF
jgi:hypothetical protein